MPDDELTHLDADGRLRMVDVSDKPPTRRRAIAQCRVALGAEAAHALRDGRTPKGNVFEAARLAGIMAAKKTSDLIPLCHPVTLSCVTVEFSQDDLKLLITAETTAMGSTGVEMEALTAVAAAALTVYDMLKAVSHEITIEQVRLIFKEGGRSGQWQRQEREL
jgi:cyclic pyranopterin phosphate synthase